jgi:ABC-type transport system substrate-binding protein
MAAIIQAQLPEIGISTEIEAAPNAGNNHTATGDPKIDELLRKGRSVMDGPKREAVYRIIKTIKLKRR